MAFLPSNNGYLSVSPSCNYLPLPNPSHLANNQTNPKTFPTPAQEIHNQHPVLPISIPRSLQIKHHYFESPIIQPRVQRCRKDSLDSTPDEDVICVIVCDTNIYMHQIKDVWRIMDSRSFKLCKVGIPWKVHNELDGLKKHRNWEIARNARLAAKHITYILKNQKQKVHCQGRLEYDQAKKLFEHENSDDSILQAILQMEESKVKHVFLHTYDTVLKNKALSIGLKLFEF